MKRLFSDTLVYGVSNVIGRMANVFLLPLYADVFSVSEYGVLSILTVLLAIITQLSSLQLESAVFRFININSTLSATKKTYTTWLFGQLSFSLFLLIGLTLFKSALSEFLFSDISLSSLLLIGLTVLPLNTFDDLCRSYWRINSKKWHVSIFNLTTLVLQIILNYIFLVHYEYGIYSIVWSSLITAILKAIISILVIKKFIQLSTFNFEHLKELLKFSIPLVPAGLSIWALTFMDRIILEKLTGLYDVGIYQIAITISSVITLPISAFLFAWTPYVYSILDEPDHRKKIVKIIETFTFVMTFLGFVCSLFSSELLYLFSDKKFYPSNPLIPILIFSNILMGLYQLSGIGSAIAKKTKPVMTSTFIATIINLTLNFTLIPSLYAYGASIATLISYSFIPIFLFFVSQKFYTLPYNFYKIGGFFIAFFTLSILVNFYFENFEFNLTYFIIKLISSILTSLCLFRYFYKYIKRNI
ncbi:MAG: oligosaccharide flippase family protein [Crocinitomicaceae bacterium]|nr:oligosaccharide flippase family protein [Crocinitomicaceae bacterium]